MSIFKHLPGIVFPVVFGLYRKNDNCFFSLLINILINLDNIAVYRLGIDFSGLFPLTNAAMTYQGHS